MDLLIKMKSDDYKKQSENFKQLQTYFKIQNQFSKLFNELINSCIKKQGAGLQYFTDNQIFMKTQYQLLSWVLSVEEQPQHIVISLSNNAYMNDILNETKVNALGTINMMLPSAILNKNESFISTNFLYMNYCIITLCYFS